MIFFSLIFKGLQKKEEEQKTTVTPADTPGEPHYNVTMNKQTKKDCAHSH